VLARGVYDSECVLRRTAAPRRPGSVFVVFALLYFRTSAKTLSDGCVPMAIWKDNTAPKRDEPYVAPDTGPVKEVDMRAEFAQSSKAPVAPAPSAPRGTIKESVIASELTIEGKIEGNGHVRLEGRFKGDVNVQGNVSIEVGAKLTGGVRADTVVIAGEIEGNITDAKRVELLETGALTGDLKAGTLTVAAGSRMRGQVEFGWDDTTRKKGPLAPESRPTS
jgi:cytoskeletal protein CcmA (bactofilin family)